MGYLLRKIAHGLLVVIVAISVAYADESPWETDIAVNYLSGQYSGNTTKDDLTGYGIKGQFEYLNQYEAVLGYSRLGIGFNSEAYSDTLYQEAFEAELSRHYFIDAFNGTVSPGVQFSKIAGNLSDSALGGLTYFGTVLNYLSYQRDWSAGLHFSKTEYEFGTNVYQYDIVVGSRLFAPDYWGQIRLLDTESQSFERHYVSADILLKHWLFSYSMFSPDSLFFAFTLGDRLLAVDPDTLVIANLSQIQKQYIRAGAQWALPEQSQLELALAYSQYELSGTDDSYSGVFLFLQYSTKW